MVVISYANVVLLGAREYSLIQLIDGMIEPMINIEEDKVTIDDLVELV